MSTHYSRVISIEMESPANEYGNYKTIKEKPEELILFVDKHVRVQLIKKSVFIGFVHSIDPISCSVILSVPQNHTYKTVLIPGHAILDLSEELIVDARPPTRRTIASSKDVSRKDKIIAWLKWNLLPASEDGDKILFGNASLLPPYDVTDICTDNPMVAMQMRKLIEAMPQDFEAPLS